jgi:hypothetical protein
LFGSGRSFSKEDFLGIPFRLECGLPNLHHTVLDRIFKPCFTMASTSINPIIPGFAPDPSIILLDGTFFLVNSTFHMFPGLPIYASKDLISWKHIGLYLRSDLFLTMYFINMILQATQSIGKANLV